MVTLSKITDWSQSWKKNWLRRRRSILGIGFLTASLWRHVASTMAPQLWYMGPPNLACHVFGLNLDWSSDEWWHTLIIPSFLLAWSTTHVVLRTWSSRWRRNLWSMCSRGGRHVETRQCYMWVSWSVWSTFTWIVLIVMRSKGVNKDCFHLCKGQVQLDPDTSQMYL
jgi:hypothetical protein